MSIEVAYVLSSIIVQEVGDVTISLKEDRNFSFDAHPVMECMEVYKSVGLMKQTFFLSDYP